MACDICREGLGLVEVNNKEFDKFYFSPHISNPKNHKLHKCSNVVCDAHWLVFSDPATGKRRQEEVIDPQNDLKKI